MNILKKACDTLREVILIYLGVIIIAATIFWIVEEQTFVDSLYWAGTTATSTGYGDISPKTIIGKVVAVLLMHAAILFVLPLVIAHMINTLIENQNEFSDEEQENLKRDIADIKRLLEENNA